MSVKRIAVLYAVWAAVALSYCWFNNALMELISPFLMIVPHLLLIIWSIASLVWGIKFLMQRRRTNGVKAGIPIVFFAVIASLCLFLPFELLKTKVEYGPYYNKRMEIVSSIQQSKIANDGRGTISLPAGYKQLSVDGEAYIYQKNTAGTIVGFWVRRGLLTGGYSSVVYTSQDIVAFTSTSLCYTCLLRI